MALQLKLKKPDPELEAILKVRPPVRIKTFLLARARKAASGLFYSMMLKQMTDEETKEYHLKKLYELSLKSLGEIPQLEKPNEEQEEWIKRRMSNPNTWPRVRENKIGDWKHWK